MPKSYWALPRPPLVGLRRAATEGSIMPRAPELDSTGDSGTLRREVMASPRPPTCLLDWVLTYSPTVLLSRGSTQRKSLPEAPASHPPVESRASWHRVAV